MNEIKIGVFKIAKNGTPFIIAEAGINHNGSVDKAFQMIQVAKEAGADAVKFQTFKAEEFVGDPGQLYTYRSQGKDVTESMLEMFKRNEFSREEWFRIKKKCDEIGIAFMSTPQNRSDLDLLLEVGISAIKVGSDDFTNLPLLEDYSGTGLPLVLSCGMADEGDVARALEAVGFAKGYPVALLVCTSQYPTPPQDVNLLRLKTIAETFPGIVPGFSDHTQGVAASVLAVGLGAVLFEKHFTLDNNMPGPDHWFSENPENLKNWVASIKSAHAMLGSSAIQPTLQEKEMRAIARRSVVTIKDIHVGEDLSLENCALRRPGTGIPPAQFKSVIGRKAIRNIKSHTPVQWGDVNQ